MFLVISAQQGNKATKTHWITECERIRKRWHDYVSNILWKDFIELIASVDAMNFNSLCLA